MPECSTCRGTCSVPSACAEVVRTRYERASAIEGPFRRPRLPVWSRVLGVLTVALLFAYARRKGWL